MDVTYFTSYVIFYNLMTNLETRFIGSCGLIPPKIVKNANYKSFRIILIFWIPFMSFYSNFGTDLKFIIKIRIALMLSSFLYNLRELIIGGFQLT